MIKMHFSEFIKLGLFLILHGVWLFLMRSCVCMVRGGLISLFCLLNILNRALNYEIKMTFKRGR